MAMADVDGKALDVEVLPRFEPWLSWRVGIAVHRSNRRDGRKLIDDRPAADIAGVQDQIDTLKGGENLRPQQAMRIRDQPDRSDPRSPIPDLCHPANLYPIPWTVRMNCGWRGLGSIFWRSHATWTSTVRVDGIEL